MKQLDLLIATAKARQKPFLNIEVKWDIESRTRFFSGLWLYKSFAVRLRYCRLVGLSYSSLEKYSLQTLVIVSSNLSILSPEIKNIPASALEITLRTNISNFLKELQS